MTPHTQLTLDPTYSTMYGIDTHTERTNMLSFKKHIQVEMTMDDVLAWLNTQPPSPTTAAAHAAIAEIQAQVSVVQSVLDGTWREPAVPVFEWADEAPTYISVLLAHLATGPKTVAELAKLTGATTQDVRGRLGGAQKNGTVRFIKSKVKTETGTYYLAK